MKERKSIEIRRSVINKAIDYIFLHLDEEISVDDVAKHCAYSKFHLMRMFRLDMDEALYQFIKRVKLERSAFRLKIEKERSITEIGEDYGYSSSNFATAFKKHLSLSPSAFRSSSEAMVEESSFSFGREIGETEEGRISVENLEPFLVICQRLRGNYHNMDKAWSEFIEKYGKYREKDTFYVECTIDDPSITDEDNCLYELCQSISPDNPILKEDKSLLVHSFEGGKYGVYHFKGYPRFLYMVYQSVFCRWLIKSGNRLDERPIFDIYRKVGDDGYMEIDICFPLK